MKLKNLILFLVLVLIVGCAQDSTKKSVGTQKVLIDKSAPSTVEVNLYLNYAEPAEITIKKGSTVIWNLRDSEGYRQFIDENQHRIVQNGAFWILEQQFTEAGVYEYSDVVTGAQGKIIVV